MDSFYEILDTIILDNSIKDYLFFVGLLLLGFLLRKFLVRIVSMGIFRLVKYYSTSIKKEDFIRLVSEPLSWTIFLIFLYLATEHIEFPSQWDLVSKENFGLKMIIHRLYQTFLFASIIWILTRIAKFIGLVLLDRVSKTNTKQDNQIVMFAAELIKIIIVIVGIFIILAVVYKLNIGGVIAGLGIGGLALALAAKESLENLLCSFIIFFDKPFIVGDLVSVDGITGVVEKVGFRSTRLRSLERTYITVPNKTMIDGQLDNWSLRTCRRAKFNIGLVYQTSTRQVAAIVKDIQDHIDAHEHTNDEGVVRFKGFGSSSLDVMISYYVNTLDWELYLKVKEEINYKIMDIVAGHKSDFAFPTRTIFTNP